MDGFRYDFKTYNHRVESDYLFVVDEPDGIGRYIQIKNIRTFSISEAE